MQHQSLTMDLLSGNSSRCLLLLFLVWLKFATSSSTNEDTTFDLTGHHFVVTGIVEPGFLEADTSGTEWEGYFYDMISALARASNFTFEMRPPSGLGSLCEHDGDDVDPFTQYGQGYRTQYTCGQSDVNDRELRGTRFASDMYIGFFWITPGRLEQNLFSTAFKPPLSGAMTMFGVATGVSSLEEVIEQQKLGLQKPICIPQGSATVNFMKDSFPELEISEFVASSSYDIYSSFTSGDCDIHVNDYPVATRFILDQYLDDACTAQGKPLGIIGKPLSFGYSQYGIGIRNDMPQDVVRAIDYWLTELMTCSPEDPECDSLAAYYTEGGTGEECGYTNINAEDKSLSAGGIVGIVVAQMVVTLGLFAVWAKRTLNKQRENFKALAVQHVAYHIALCPNSYDLNPDVQLVEFEKLLRKHRRAISKLTLRVWMLDKKLYYLTDKDFDALWGALDIDESNSLDPEEFIEYMGVCGPDFDRLNAELRKLPKQERLAWVSERLTSLDSEGAIAKSQHHVRKMSTDSALCDNLIPAASVRFQTDASGRVMKRTLPELHETISDESKV